MTSAAPKKFRVTIEIVEQHSAIVAAESPDAARNAADDLYSACNIDAFDITYHTFEVVDVDELAADDPMPAVNTEVAS